MVKCVLCAGIFKTESFCNSDMCQDCKKIYFEVQTARSFSYYMAMSDLIGLYDPYTVAWCLEQGITQDNLKVFLKGIISRQYSSRFPEKVSSSEREEYCREMHLKHPCTIHWVVELRKLYHPELSSEEVMP